MQCPSNKQDYIVDHVTVSDKIQESGQRLHCLVTHMLKFNDQFLPQFVINCGHSKGRRFVGQKGAVVGALKVQFQVCNPKINLVRGLTQRGDDPPTFKGFTLHQIQVIGVFENATLETAA